jgi:hypothetical protein
MKMKILLFSVNSLLRTCGAFVKTGKFLIKICLRNVAPISNCSNKYWSFPNFDKRPPSFSLKEPAYGAKRFCSQIQIKSRQFCKVRLTFLRRDVILIAKLALHISGG